MDSSHSDVQESNRKGEVPADGYVTKFHELADRNMVCGTVVNTITQGMQLETMTLVQSMTINETLQGVDVYVYHLYYAILLKLIRVFVGLRKHAQELARLWLFSFRCSKTSSARMLASRNVGTLEDPLQPTSEPSLYPQQENLLSKSPPKHKGWLKTLELLCKLPLVEIPRPLVFEESEMKDVISWWEHPDDSMIFFRTDIVVSKHPI